MTVPDPLRIVATAAVPPVAHAAFAPLGEIALAATHDDLLPADVVIVRGQRLDAATIHASRARVIARTGVGLENVDVDAATEAGIPVVFAPDAGTLPVAEGIIALIVATTKRLGELGALLRSGAWEDRYGYEVRDWTHTTLGIVGLGRIGREVARLAQAIGMRVVAHEPRAGDHDDAPADGAIELMSLARLVSVADVVSLHCDLNASTRGLVDRDLLSRLRPGAVLVNGARGGIIADERLLGEALDRGWLSAVGLDVFTVEPPPCDDPLLHDPRVVCTPHSVGLSRAWNERVFRSLARDVERVLGGGTPRWVANPEALPSATRARARARSSTPTA
jgi:phosphoglycerate dehydrogenase-like enzyme